MIEIDLDQEKEINITQLETELLTLSPELSAFDRVPISCDVIKRLNNNPVVIKLRILNVYSKYDANFKRIDIKLPIENTDAIKTVIKNIISVHNPQPTTKITPKSLSERIIDLETRLTVVEGKVNV